MEARYLGFKQQQSARSYRFDVVEKSRSVGEETGRRPGEGLLGGHELTAEDLLSYVNARALAQAKQAEMRKALSAASLAGGRAISLGEALQPEF
jgi:hypothetical protein